MTSLSDFHTFARSNMMELEVILSEVYAARVSGETGFTMFDGGAHKGFHTKKMLDLPGCERVFAVEADPFMAETLQKNLADRIDRPLPQLHIIQKALQDNPSVTTIAWKSSPSHVGRSSIVSDNAKRSTIWRDNADIQYRDEMRIEATTIDLILAGETAPLPFLKLDLEGADLLALRGASREASSSK